MGSPLAGGAFPETNWSLIVQSGTGDEAAQSALNRLCRLYWQPLYVYGRRRGLNKEDAEDVVQTFLASVTACASMASLEPRAVRFRSWLLSGFTHHLHNHRRAGVAACRGGGAAPLPFDGEVEMSAQSSRLSPDEAYDRQWARQVLRQAMERLRGEQMGDGDAATFDLLLPAITKQSAETHRELAGRLGLTESGVGVMIHRYRKRLREIFRHEVTLTVADPAEVDAEMNALLELAAAGA